jgi:hypothetical protein
MLIYIVFFIFFDIISVNIAQRQKDRERERERERERKRKRERECVCVCVCVCVCGRAKFNPISLLAATNGYIKTALPLT